MSQTKLKQLRDKWDKKLKDSGFKDIENSHPDRQLKHYDSIEFQRYYTPDAFEAKRRYFELAGHLLHEHKFRSQKHKDIWELHCQGKQFPEIARKFRTTTMRIYRIIKQYDKFIKVKE